MIWETIDRIQDIISIPVMAYLVYQLYKIRKELK